MPVAELIVHATLLTLAVFLVAAAVATAKEKWLPSRKEKKPQNRKENQSMTNNTNACGHTPLQHATRRLTRMARQAQQDSEDPTFTSASSVAARLTATILNNIVDTVMVPALMEESALSLGVDLVAIADSLVKGQATQGVDQMAEFLQSEATDAG